mmetsp:Transcript_32258/g.90339  ORF Transcript_32258/g.90339 Transcript_32258/m.90339 type:complete len:221 (-) Transcript_32258:617-1279(-)
MLLGHQRHSHVRSHQQHGVVRHMPCHPRYSGFEVTFVTCEIKEGDDFAALLDNVGPARGVEAGVVVYNVALGVEPHDLFADRRRATRVDFMLVREDVKPCGSPAVIRPASGQDADHGALAGVDIAAHGHTDLRNLAALPHLAYQDLGRDTLQPLALVQDADLRFQALRHLLQRGDRLVQLLWGDPLKGPVVIHADLVDGLSVTLAHPPLHLRHELLQTLG